MIDHFSIFTKGGIVLWSHTVAKPKGNPIDILIRNVILEERGGENSYTFDQYTLKWTFANEFDLIFVVVYQKILSLLYIEELLEAVKRKFIDTFGDKIKNTSLDFEFTDIFIELLDSIENRSAREREKQKQKGPKSFYETEKGKQKKEKEPAKPDQKKKKPKEEEKDETAEDTNDDTEASEPNDSESNDSSVENPDSESNDNQNLTDDQIKANIEKMRLKLSGKTKKPTKSVTSPSAPTTKAQRGDRKWDDKISNEEKKALDYSKRGSSDTSNVETIDVTKGKQINLDEWEEEPEEQDEPEEPSNKQQQQTPTTAGRLFSFFQSISGNKPLDENDLAPILAKFKDHLVSKNVASEIAEKLCESVSASLQGKKLGTFGNLKNTISNALEEALIRILTPKRFIDILRDVKEAKDQGRPYTITFCGVNGVGKSTNLAKICAYLMQNGYSVLIAACDTFRAGAVEQLNVHCRRLGVELYERGYRSDPTAIASDAIRQAKLKGKDVVLVDTAGRMQDNDLLMKALSRLVNTVKPDLVLFVGEALVGHDAVDQLVKFNQALIDLSKEKEPRKIDGIILTKFDTIDDKVGAALSMVYTTGQPIVFVGVGQHYTDLKRLNVHAVTKSLLKGA